MFRALPCRTNSDLLGKGTWTIILVEASFDNVSTVDDKRLTVTSLSPHNHLSSMWGSIDDPRVGLYSRWHTSTGEKSASDFVEFIFETVSFKKDGSPVKFPIFTFLRLKFACGPKS